MQPRNFRGRVSAVGFLLLWGSLLSLSFLSPHKQLPDKGTKTLIHGEPGYTINKIISAKELAVAFTRSKSPKMIIGIYPVKLSNNREKNDFDVQISFQHRGEYADNNEDYVNLNTFRTKATWYIDYLKRNNIPREKVPVGYFIEIDKRIVPYIMGLAIAVDPGNSSLQFYQLIGASEIAYVDSIKKSRTVFNCPPPTQGMFSMTMASDSAAGKCPPSCSFLSSALRNTMKAVIAGIYSRQ